MTAPDPLRRLLEEHFSGSLCLPSDTLIWVHGRKAFHRGSGSAATAPDHKKAASTGETAQKQTN